MSRPTFSDRDIIKALDNWGFTRVPGGKGSHTKLKYIHPHTGETRIVIIPRHDEIDTGTLRNIAEQAGANDFQKFLDEMERMA